MKFVLLFLQVKMNLYMIVLMFTSVGLSTEAEEIGGETLGLDIGCFRHTKNNTDPSIKVNAVDAHLSVDKCLNHCLSEFYR